MGSKIRWGSTRSLRGFLLVEALAVLLILGVAGAFSVPLLWDWQEERRIDLAAAELASAIREAEMEARSGSASNAASTIAFYCYADSDSRIIYETRRGTKLITPKGKLHPHITAGGRLYITFRKDSFAGSDNLSKYSMYLRTQDGKHERQIVVAMYTGRVRVVKTKG